MKTEDYERLSNMTNLNEEQAAEVSERVFKGRDQNFLDTQYSILANGADVIQDVSEDLDILKKYLIYNKTHSYDDLTSLDTNNVIGLGDKYPNNGVVQEGGVEKVDVFHGLIGIFSEVGELAPSLKSLMSGEEIDKVNLKEELGDLMWYIARVARGLDVSLEDVMMTNVKKLAKRYPNKFSSESALNRDLEAERKILEENGSSGDS